MHESLLQYVQSSILELSPSAILIFDVHGIVRYANRRVHEWLEFEPEEYLGKHLVMLPFLTPQGKLTAISKFAARISGKIIEPYEMDVRKKSGQTFAGRIDGTQVKDSSGKAIGSLIMVTDVSAERKIEERFRALAEHSSDGLVLLAENGLIIYASPSVEVITGYTADELIGKNSQEFIEPRYRDELRSIVENVQKKAGSIEKSEFKIIKKDGRNGIVESVWTNHLDTPSIRAIVVNFRDITAQKFVERKLSDTENFLRNIINVLGDPVFVKDEKHVIVLVNEALAKISGTSPDEMIGKTDYDFFPKEQVEIYWKKDDEVLESGRENVNEEKITGSDGKVRTIVTKKTRYENHNREKFIVGVIRDISEVTQAVEKVKKSEEWYRLFVQSSGLLIYDHDIASGNISWAGAIRDITGFSEDEYAQYNVDRFREHIHPDDRDSAMSALTEAIEHGHEFKAEYRYKTKHGSYIRVEDHGYPILDTNGRNVRLVGSMADVTMLKQSQSQVSLFTEALKSTAVGIVITDTEGTIQWSNPAFTQLTGYLPEETVGQNPRLWKSGEMTADFYHELWSTIQAGNVWQGEIRNKRKNGEIYDEEMTVTPVKNEKGVITHFIGVKQDITQRKKQESVLRKNNEDLEKLNKLMVGRELRMAELKKSIREMEGRVNKSKGEDK